mmetsp:Transcript_26548/g.30869  ORF Transcript_26548/g.30869 Transcript_26548/m.30869 type:complete len:664 (-) Transcript_26548:205-2196(-)
MQSNNRQIRNNMNEYYMIDDDHRAPDRNVAISTKNKNKFDLASWLQQGAFCGNSKNYNQLGENDVLRSTSFSSATFSTEDNSSFNSLDSSIDNTSGRGEYVDHVTRFESNHKVNNLERNPHLIGQTNFDQSLGLSKLNVGIKSRADINRDFGRDFHFSPKKTTCNNTKTKPISKISMPQNPKKQQREWRSAIDAKSGKIYYYNERTRETQWRKPIELASKSERQAIAEKEQKQRDFFHAMEKNILNCMEKGQIPGPLPDSEDVVKSLPKPSSSKRKPKLIRTISSMDSELYEELTKDGSERKDTKIFSPDSSATPFFNSLPQPASTFSPPSRTPSLAHSSFEDSSFEEESNTSPISFTPSKECTKIIPRPSLTKRNTCGTMYVMSTMSDPDKDAAIKCVCGLYRAHIIQSTKDTNPITKFAEYEIFNDINNWNTNSSQRYHYLNSASITPADFGIEMTIKSNKKNPSLDEITNYFRFIFRKAQMESDCIIMSLIYVERLLRETNGGVRPNLQNWKSLLFACMIMASKVWDDLSMWNADFSQACPAGVTFSLQRINELELTILSCLNYDVKVQASEYAKYYFLMRSMLIRSGLAGEEFKESKPLDLESAKKFEFLSASYKAKLTTPANLRRTRSLGGDNEVSSLRSPSSQLEQVVKMSGEGTGG